MPPTFPVITPDPGNCLLGRGAVGIDLFTAAGATQGYLQIGNASDLNVDPNEEHETLPNYLTADAGAYADALVQRTLTGSVTVYEFMRRNIALLSGGVESTYTQGATPLTGEVLTTSALLGAQYQTAKRKIGTVTVLMGTTTLVLATDYTILSTEKGLIQVLTTSPTVTAGATLTINYTPTAITGSQQRTIELASAGTLHGRLRFDGNPAYGPALEMIWWHVVLQASQLQGLLGRSFGSSVVNFKIISDAAGNYGGTAGSPYGRCFLPFGAP